MQKPSDASINPVGAGVYLDYILILYSDEKKTSCSIFKLVSVDSSSVSAQQYK